MALNLTFKGFNYTSYYNGGFTDADSLPALAATGANSVALNIENGIDVANSQVYSDPAYTDSLTTLGSTIDQAKALGLNVMVRPLIDFLDPAKIGTYGVDEFRSYYNPANVASFFASYKTMIVAEAQVAQAHGADSLCVGTELDQLTGPADAAYWTDIIAAVKAVYTGKLTYSADWNDDISPWAGHHGLGAGTGNLATQVSFWNQLDYAGVDAYPALSDAADPTAQQLVDGWTQVPTDPDSKAATGNQSLISYFSGVAAAIGKPLLFTEIGYENATDAALEPAGSATNVENDALQARLYQAFFDAWSQSGPNVLAGAYFWNWDPNASEVGPGSVAFSPQNLPALAVVTAGFSAAAPPPPAGGPALAFTPAVTVKTPTSVTLTGTASDPAGVARVELFEGATDLGAATLTPDGTWSFKHAFAPGFHNGLAAKATDTGGRVSVVASDYDLTTGIQHQPYAATLDNYSPGGTFLGQTQFTKKGGTYLQYAYLAEADGHELYDYQSGSFFNGAPYSSYQDLFTATGDIGVETFDNRDGSHDTVLYADGQQATAQGSDAFTGVGARETFVFDAGSGQDVVDGFRLTGSGHDTLSLPRSDFSSIAQVLAHTVDAGGQVVIDLGGGDGISVAGVTKAELRANKKDFVLHA